MTPKARFDPYLTVRGSSRRLRVGKIVCVADSAKNLDALILEANSIALRAIQEE